MTIGIGSTFHAAPVVFSPQPNVGEKRPSALEKIIDECFDKASRKTAQGGYPVTSDETYQFGYADKKLTSDAFVSPLKKQGFSQPVKILDVGCGSGAFMLRANRYFGVDAMGITASDLRNNSLIPNDKYYLGNVERIAQDGRFMGAQFDGIVSAMTFMHLADPLAALVQLYDLLAPNGMLCVDKITCFGMNGYMKAMVDYLNDQGYRVRAGMRGSDEKQGKWSYILIQKTHPHLRLPVQYAEPVWDDLRGCIKYLPDYSCLKRIPDRELQIEEPPVIDRIQLFSFKPEDFQFFEIGPLLV